MNIEFWILPSDEMIGPYVFKTKVSDCIHVIEYSAYESLKAENERLRNALENAMDELKHAVKYLDASYVNVEDCEPEVQMCNGFKKCITDIDKVLGEKE